MRCLISDCSHWPHAYSMQNIDLKSTQLKFLGHHFTRLVFAHWQLGEHNFWINEYMTLHMIQGSPQQVINTAANDFHPPLYFLMLHFWSELMGTSDFSLRWPSIAASLLCLPLLVVVARRLADSRIALWSVLLLSLAPATIEFGRMARYYSWVTEHGCIVPGRRGRTISSWFGHFLGLF